MDSAKSLSVRSAAGGGWAVHQGGCGILIAGDRVAGPFPNWIAAFGWASEKAREQGLAIVEMAQSYELEVRRRPGLGDWAVVAWEADAPEVAPAVTADGDLLLDEDGCLPLMSRTGERIGSFSTRSAAERFALEVSAKTGFRVLPPDDGVAAHGLVVRREGPHDVA